MVDTQENIAPSTQLDFETWATDDGKWVFYHSSYPMSNTKELDKL